MLSSHTNDHQCAGAVVEFLGLYHLYKLFFRYCYEPQNREDLFKNELVPKPNDFSDFSEYFLRKVRAIYYVYLS